MTLRSAFRGLLESIVIALMVALALLVITAVLFRKGGASRSGMTKSPPSCWSG